MANKRITDVDFLDSLNSNESFFVNQNNAIKQINKANIVFDISNGGTGASNASDARTNLGIGSVATENTVPVSKGGTGATSASAALKNLGITASATELNYVDGVTSSIQTQLNKKVESGHQHTVANISDLTVTAKELNYVDGVTSAIQTQLDNRLLLTIGTPIQSNSDLNDFTDVGKYYSANSTITASLANAPVTGAGFGLIVMDNYIDGRVYQIVLEITNNIYTRYYNGSNWSKWNKLIGNILSSDEYGTTLPTAGTKGRIFFKKVSS